MPDLTAKRTLVKSPPELWAELSEVEGLSRHLGEFGEIKISRLDPEKTVAWEGEHACGTVEIEASSWGTKVVLTADVAEIEMEEPAAAVEVVEEEPEPEPEPEPEVAPEPEPEPYQRASWLDSLREPEPRELADGTEPEPVVEAESLSMPRRGFLSRWFFRERRGRVDAVPPEPAWDAPAPESFEPEPEPEPFVEAPIEVASEEPVAETTGPQTRPAIDEERALAVLEDALDNLGSAHHRPFSRG